MIYNVVYDTAITLQMDNSPRKLLPSLCSLVTENSVVC